MLKRMHVTPHLSFIFKNKAACPAEVILHHTLYFKNARNLAQRTKKSTDEKHLCHGLN